MMHPSTSDGPRWAIAVPTAAAISAPRRIQKNSFIVVSFSPHLARHQTRVAHLVSVDHARRALRPRLPRLRTGARRAGDARPRAARNARLALLRGLLGLHRGLLLRLRLLDVPPDVRLDLF